MDTITTIVIAVISSTAVGGVVQLLLNRMFVKRDRKDNVSISLKDIDKRLRRTELADSQTHLLLLINFYPSDHKSILCEAEHYICELGGNAWIWSILTEWARAEGVSIAHLEEVHKASLLK